MAPIDFIIIGIIALIIGSACFYIYKAKKSGKKCIGCPNSAACHSGTKCDGGCTGCTGECHCDDKSDS